MPRFGWKKDTVDERDYRLPLPEKAVYPAEYDLGTQFPERMLPILNQGDIGSCVFNAGSRAVYFNQIKQKQSPFMPSRLEWYYWGRFLEGTTGSDEGCSIRNACKALNRFGVCREDLWKYVRGNLYKEPNAAVMENAALHKSVCYQRVQRNLDALKDILVVHGFPILFGIAVYPSFDKITKDGIVPLPKLSTEECQGGHGMEIEGYSDSKGCFRVANSWGKTWGDKGYCWLPYEYVLNAALADDFWYIELMQQSG